MSKIGQVTGMGGGGVEVTLKEEEQDFQLFKAPSTQVFTLDNYSG